MPKHNKSKVPVGTVLEGKFSITREIGRGGMAAVYEAENIDIRKRVAVKILAAELITSRVVRERFIREARAVAAIRSPYICDVYDSGTYEERPFIVMELLEGESLYDRMTRVRRMDIHTVARIATDTARGLTKAHENNVIHRDLKPENIFLTHNEEGELVAKLLDFGLAKFYEPTEADEAQTRLTREGALFGTPAYMSPEQAKGQGGVDHRCDIWALGCIVYECLTGQTVWNVDQGVAMILAQIATSPLPRPSRLRPDLPPSFDDWFAKALARDPNQRFQTAKELADGLNWVVSPENTKSPVGPPVQSNTEEAAIDQIIESQRTPSLDVPVSLDSIDVAPEPIRRPTLPPGLKSRTGTLIGLAALATAMAVGAYAVWLYVINPTDNGRPMAAMDAGALEAGGAVAARAPVEKESYALQISAGQKWLVEGKPDNAARLFREAFNNSGSGIARAMMAHTAAIVEAGEGECRVTGLGRPRPFDVTSPTSRPTVALGSSGLLIGWVDNHEDRKRRQGYVTLVDDHLRRVSEAQLVTPEANSVRHPQLVSANGKLAMIYWDGGGKEPGVYVRMLEPDGRIKSPARRVSAVKRHEFFPTLVSLGKDGFWASWEEQTGSGEDLFGRRLKQDLTPASDAVRLTSFVSSSLKRSAAGRPDAALAKGHLNLSFSLTREKTHQIFILRTAIESPKLAKGVEESSQEDETVGKLVPVGPEHGKSSQPRIACTSDGCLVAWDDESAGAFAAFVDSKTWEPIWHREFSPKGSRPALASYGDKVVVAWYEDARLKLAQLTRDGVGSATVLARVSGMQPYPALIPGNLDGEWYVSWRDYESGHLEAFVVRAKCQ